MQVKIVSKYKISTQKPVVAVNPENGSFEWLAQNGITQSILKTWRSTCPKKARFVLDGYSRPQTGGAIVFGTIFHGFLEEIFSQIKNGASDVSKIDFLSAEKIVRESLQDELVSATPAIIKEYERNLGMAFEVVKIYFDYWKDQYFGSDKKTWVQIEDKFKVFPPEMNGIPFMGRRDGVFRNKNGKLWLFETKTKASWDDENLLKLLSRELQVIVYIKTYEMEFGEMPEGVEYNIIRRPQLRMKESESTREFCQRVKIDILDRPSFYFSKLQMPIPKEMVEYHWGKILKDCQRFIEWYQGKYDSEYTENCISSYGACQFLVVCSGGVDDRIVKSEITHKELAK